MDSPEKINKFIEDAGMHGVNMLFIQVLGRGEAYYRSALLPEKVSSFDPLQTAVEKAHSLSIEVHAWLNTYYVWSNPVLPTNPLHVVNAHPEWLLTENNTKYLDPSNLEVQDYLYKVYLEVARKYKIDGIHFDYVRYPSERTALNARNRRLFSNSYWVDPKILLEQPARVINFYGKTGYKKLKVKWEDFRCGNVTRLVRRISAGVKAINPNIKVSAAVFPDIRISRGEKGQDWITWLREGSIDFAAPMIYSDNMSRVRKLIVKSASISGNHKVVIGLGAYKMSPDKVMEQITMIRNFKKQYNSIAGFCLFSYDSIAANPQYLEQIRKNAF